MRIKSRIVLALAIIQVLISSWAAAQYRILTHREQSSLQKEWLDNRFNALLPELMRREEIDMWLIISREYNDDPIFSSMVPPTVFSSRRRTILAFCDRGPGQGIERFSIGRFDYEGLFKLEKTRNDGQWEGLRALVERRNPKVIGINVSELFSHADGLSATERDNLTKALGMVYAARLKSAEKLAVNWLETRLPTETAAYRNAMKVAHQIIAEAFSNKVISPGITTTEDVIWWMRQRAAEMGLGLWFHPSVSAFRKGDRVLDSTSPGKIIQRGDLLHCDFGIVYLGFATDTQQNAYVLLPNETDAPAGLKDGLRAANRLQEITLNSAKPGMTGNSVLELALTLARKEGLHAAIYCHPIGCHGHEAGPAIGMVDYQSGVPGRGEWPLLANTWHAIELHVTHPVKEWNNQTIPFGLEEDAVLLETGWDWIDGRQTSFHLIK